MTATDAPRHYSHADDAKSVSQVLRDLCGLERETITIGEIVESFGGRAFGAVLFVLAMPILLPFPPGLSAILGLPLFLIAPQMAMGVETPWLPRRLARRRIRTADLRRAFQRRLPLVERVERVSRPRMTWLFGHLGERLMGVVCTILALVLMLPIPLGNVLPAVAIGVLGIALVQRDGVLAIAGYLVAAVGAAAMVLAAGAVGRGLHHLVTMIGVA